MMEPSIEHRRRHRRVTGKSVVPLCEWQIARNDDGAAFVPLRDDLKEVTIVSQGVVYDRGALIG